MTGNITSFSKGKTGKNTMIEDVADDIYKLPYSDLAKVAAILFDKIDHGKARVLPS